MKALVDYRIKDVFLNFIEEKKVECIKVKCKNVYDEVSGHPDIFFTVINGKLVKASNVETSENVIGITGENVENGYPNTAKYNICVNNKYAIGNFKYVEKNIKIIIESSDLEKISVNQGYTRCSLFSIDETHYITSDLGIKKKLEDKGLNVLYITSNNIRLLDKNSNYSKMNGFIGGALFKLKNNIVLFGDISKLEQGIELKEYIENLGYNFIYFEGEEVIDYGSVIFLN